MGAGASSTPLDSSTRFSRIEAQTEVKKLAPGRDETEVGALFDLHCDADRTVRQSTLLGLATFLDSSSAVHVKDKTFAWSDPPEKFSAWLREFSPDHAAAFDKHSISTLDAPHFFDRYCEITSRKTPPWLQLCEKVELPAGDCLNLFLKKKNESGGEMLETGGMGQNEPKA